MFNLKIKIHKMQNSKGFVDIVKWQNIGIKNKYMNENGLVKIVVVRLVKRIGTLLILI